MEASLETLGLRTLRRAPGEGGGGAGGPWTLKQSVSVSIYTITRRVVLQSDVRTMLSLRLRGSSRAALYMAHISRYPCA